MEMPPTLGKGFYNKFLTGRHHDGQEEKLRNKYDGNLRDSDRGNKIEVSQVSNLQAENIALKKQLAEQQERLARIEKMLEGKGDAE